MDMRRRVKGFQVSDIFLLIEKQMQEPAERQFYSVLKSINK